MTSVIPTYTEEDLMVRKAIAAGGMVKLAGKIATDTRRGSESFLEQKLLEIALAQFDCIKSYKVVETKAKGIYKPLANLFNDAIIATGVTIDSIQVADPFLFTDDPLQTAKNVIAAFESFSSTPEYTTELVGSEVHITAVNPGASSNGLIIDVLLIPGMSDSRINFYGGQDGVQEEDNLISEVVLEQVFNNISQITGCGYAPLGTKYK